MDTPGSPGTSDPPGPSNPAGGSILVAAGIVWKAGRFLAVQRPPGTIMAGYWEFPGGKVEAGETIEEALRRELFEELHITVQEQTFCCHAMHQYPHGHVTVHFFHVDRWQGAPYGREGHVLKWCAGPDTAALSFLPADHGVLQAICADNTRLTAPCQLGERRPRTS